MFMSRSSVSSPVRRQWSLGLLLGALLTLTLTLPVRSHAVDSIQAVDTNVFAFHTSVVLDANGFPVISYYDQLNGDLKLAHCNDANCTGNDGSIQTVDTAGNVGFDTSLVLDANGFPVISYRDVTNNDLKLAHCNDANCAGNDESIQTVDAAGNVGSFSSVILDTSGFPIISYWDVTNRDLKLVHCNDANCAGNDESIQTVDAAGDVGLYTSVVLDTNGFPVISYSDNTRFTLKLAHCNDANCAGNDESLQTVDIWGAGGFTTSLVLDANGFPVLSYVDLINSTLKLAHCNDANCAGNDESIQTIAAGNVNPFISLELDANGFPVISYWDVTNEDLKLAHCNDANCAGNDESIQTVDAAGDVGRYLSLVLDANGFPVISYRDGFNRALKLAHCDDANCAPNQPPVAQCNNVTVSTLLNTCAAASASINNNSFDPENDPLTLTQSPVGPYPLGTTSVQLTVSDGTDSNQCTGTVTVVDGQAPTLTCPGNQTATATSSSGAPVSFALTASDNCGTVIPSCTPTSGSSFLPGSTSVTCTATDGAGLQSSCSFSVQVNYAFTGFFHPVDNPPVVNEIKAGKSLQVKFSLGGDFGLDVLADNSPSSQAIACQPGDPVDPIEEETTSNSGLTYDATTNQYKYAWKTQKAWAGTCRQLKVTLEDGTEHTALFMFK